MIKRLDDFVLNTAKESSIVWLSEQWSLLYKKVNLEQKFKQEFYNPSIRSRLRPKVKTTFWRKICLWWRREG